MVAKPDAVPMVPAIGLTEQSEKCSIRRAKMQTGEEQVAEQIMNIAHEIVAAASSLQNFDALNALEIEARKTHDALYAALDAVRTLVDLAKHH